MVRRPDPTAPLVELLLALEDLPTDLTHDVDATRIAVEHAASAAEAVLLVARAASAPFTAQEQLLLRGLATALSLARRAGRAVEAERAGWDAGSTQDTADLLASLRERQVLLEPLSRIQRSISSRQPLLQVLDTIVAGAAELLGDDIVGLRLVDAKDPRFMALRTAPPRRWRRRCARAAGRSAA